jgi:hypothetical protein
MSEKQLLKSLCQDNIIRAVAANRKGKLGFKKARKLFNLPKTFLRTYVNIKDKPPEEAALTKLGRKPEFSKDME